MRWGVQFTRPLVYAGAVVAAGAIVVVAIIDHGRTARALVDIRQLLGLWALALLLVALIVGPLVAVLPWLPLKSHLIYARRAIGVCAFGFAAAHVVCYLASPLSRGWRELYSPGALWLVGLLLGLTALVGMSALALTSTDAAVKRMGGRRWKRLHRAIYAILLIVFAHAMCVGADFGLNRAPDVGVAPDAGALIGFLCFTAAWLCLFLLRWRRIRLGPPNPAPRELAASNRHGNARSSPTSPRLKAWRNGGAAAAHQGGRQLIDENECM